jgi:UDP-N-acetyl-D-mannosaminuronate dehydrogenase
LIKKLNRTKHKITIQDPIVYKKNKEITVINIMPNLKNFDLVIFCVAHKAYKKINFKKLPKKPIYIDLNIVFSEKNKKYLRDKKYKVKVLGDD